jgi:flagellar protein FlaF
VGFSVSGSFAILVLASFIAFGMLQAAGTNSFERVSDATQDAYEGDLDRRNTAIEISELDYQGNHLDVNVTNSGTTALSLDATDLIVNGTYHAPDEYTWSRVDGDPNTELWLPGQSLEIRIQLPGLDTPARVKIVTEYGVADAEVVA